MNIRLIILLIAIVAFKNNVLSQKEFLSDIDREKIITGQLYAKGKIILEKLVEDEKKADNLMNVADQYYKQLSKYRLESAKTKAKRKRKKLYKKMVKVENKALDSRVESLDNYHNVAVLKYQVYKIDLQKFIKTSSQSKLDSVKVWEKLAYDSFEEADAKVNIAYHTINHGDLFNIYTQAYKLEQIGLLYQHKIYSLFLGWPQTNYSSINQEILALKKNIPFYNNKDEKNVSEKKIADSIVYEKVVVYDTVIVQKKMPGLIFKIQIAASKDPISIADLRKIYYADDIVNTEVENGWYKYSVGFFETYREARKFKINIGVSDAFVVAYKSGKKIEIPKVHKSTANE